MRIAVVGARDHRALAQVWRRVRELPDGTVVVSGGCPRGGDAVAEISARQRGLEVASHPADWVREDGSVDRSAGFRRNGDVVADCDELDAFPWPGCKGTLDTIRKAQKRGIPVRIHEPEAPGLLVFSAQRRYAGHGAICIMRHGGEGDGLAFAPTEALLQRVLSARGEAAKLREAAASLRGRQMNLGEGADEVAARELRAAGMEEQAARIEADAWAWYRPRFVSEMRVSYGLARGSAAWERHRELHEEAWERGARPRPDAWRRLLARSFCVITCGCPDPERCHRGILRAEILLALGAVDGGEVPTR